MQVCPLLYLCCSLQCARTCAVRCDQFGTKQTNNTAFFHALLSSYPNVVQAWQPTHSVQCPACASNTHHAAAASASAAARGAPAAGAWVQTPAVMVLPSARAVLSPSRRDRAQCSRCSQRVLLRLQQRGFLLELKIQTSRRRLTSTRHTAPSTLVSAPNVLRSMEATSETMTMCATHVYINSLFPICGANTSKARSHYFSHQSYEFQAFCMAVLDTCTR
jgi:DNA-directed RNA polymerase subunit RPC12/RpoP